MYDLSIIKLNGGCYIDSREVATAIGKAHKNLLRDIAGYAEYMRKSTKLNFEPSDFFIESTYIDSTGRTLPCYLLSKMGCEMVANKLTGEKGVLFTAAYVAKFNEMETAEHATERTVKTVPNSPRLGEYNAAARLIVRAMKNIGAAPEKIIEFLKGVYEPIGISVADCDIVNAPRMYTAKQIAEMLGVYSTGGNPHYHAISAILNENILISDSHKTVMTMDYGDHIGVSIQYDEYAVREVMDWLTEYGWPKEIYGFERTYRVIYKI